MAKKDVSLIYSYKKIRKDFGRQPMFCETRPVLLDTIRASIPQQNLYCLRNPVNREAQTPVCFSQHEVNTKTIVLNDRGVHHSEGGWPTDISCNDEEATTRYRRRAERDDSYINTVLNMYPELVHYVDQNNAIEMYDVFFKNMLPQEPIEKSNIKIYNVFKHSINCPISCIGWTHEDEPKLVVTYCDKSYPLCDTNEESFACYLWNIEISNEPFTEFCPPSPCWQVVCSPEQPAIILGGLRDGRVSIFDIRASKEPLQLSEVHLSHTEPVTSLLYIQSRLNNEFFSGSTDGRCLWWDIRNISQPIDALIMSIRIPPGEQMSLANAEPVSALQYDRTLPTKFLCGTDTGFVINVNRKGKSYQETMSAIFHAHHGPVKSVHRSPCLSKIFITCGDWKVNIWSDDVHTSPIITGLGHRYRILDVVWAPHRFSSYMSVGSDGKLRYWDLLRRFRDPVSTLRVSKYPLLKLKPHGEGKLIAIGDIKGTLHLLSLSENLVLSGDKDKQLMIQTFERETRREHILETRVKEIRLKVKTEEECDRRASFDAETYENILRNTEEQYRQIVSDELGRTGVASAVSGMPRKKCEFRL